MKVARTELRLGAEMVLLIDETPLFPVDSPVTRHDWCLAGAQAGRRRVDVAVTTV